jgi:hypothetical protein
MFCGLHNCLPWRHYITNYSVTIQFKTNSEGACGWLIDWLIDDGFTSCWGGDPSMTFNYSNVSTAPVVRWPHHTDWSAATHLRLLPTLHTFHNTEWRTVSSPSPSKAISQVSSKEKNTQAHYIFHIPVLRNICTYPALQQMHTDEIYCILY